VYRGQRLRISAHWMSGSLWLVISNHWFLVLISTKLHSPF
jgi:hypothetical protein